MTRVRWFAYLLLVSVPFAWSAPTSATPVTLQNATATYSQHPGLGPLGCCSVGLSIDGNTAFGSNWAIANDSTGFSTSSPQTAVYETATDVNAGLLTIGMFQHHPLAGHLLGRFRFSVTTDSRSDFADGLNNGGDVTATWTVLTPTSATGTVIAGTAGLTFTILGDGSVLVAATGPLDITTATYTLLYDLTLSGVTGIRLEALEDPSLPDSGPGLFSNGNFSLNELTVDIGPAATVPEPSTLVLLTTWAGVRWVVHRLSERRRRAV